MIGPNTKKWLLTIVIGVVYCFLVFWVVRQLEETVSIAYIFCLPFVVGAIPVFILSRKVKDAYITYIIGPFAIVFFFFALAFLFQIDGAICLIVLFGPFLLLGGLGGFIYMLIIIRRNKHKDLYVSLMLPLIVLAIERNFEATDSINTIATSIVVDAPSSVVWEQIKNVKNIREDEIETHFIHLIGVPKPINGELDKEGPGGIREITWAKGIRFREHITAWKEGVSFAYDIDVDPKSIPPKTLDEHVMIGGKYFDVLKGSYTLDSTADGKCLITLSCTYRVTTNLNFYSKIWADFMLDDFQEMILEVVKKRSEGGSGS